MSADLTANDMHPLAIISRALDKGVGADQMKLFMDLKIQHEAHEARKDFYIAFAAFKAERPTINKNKNVNFPGKDGKPGTSFDHATLDEVSDVIGDALAKHGLSHRWETMQADGGIIQVTCILSNDKGHCEKTTLKSLPDQTGSKNAIQAVGSAVTYLQRYTLLAATGCAAKGIDDDGKGTEGLKPFDKAETDWLKESIQTVYGDNWEPFLKWLGVKSLDEMTRPLYAKAKAVLDEKLKKLAAKVGAK